jgi:urease accessory protein
LTVGPHAVGWDGPAVTGGRRAIGSLVVVDPTWGAHPPQPVLLGDDAVVLPLAGPAALVSALTPDALTLRRCLDAALGRLTGDCPEQPRIAQRASEER